MEATGSQIPHLKTHDSRDWDEKKLPILNTLRVQTSQALGLSTGTDDEKADTKQQPPSKKRRLRVEVSIPPFREVRARQRAHIARENTRAREQTVLNANVKDEPIDVELFEPVKAEVLSDEMLIQKMESDQVVIKKDVRFDYKVVTDRLRAAGLDTVYPVNLDEKTLNFTFKREYLHNLYGGGAVSTYPRAQQEKRETHGIDDFMCLVLDLNPHAPVNAGVPGLTCCEGRASPYFTEVRRVIVRVRDKPPAMWKYVGQYKHYPSESLTVEEFAQQAPRVRRGWSQDMLTHSWGELICARVYLRRELGREPSAREAHEVVEDRDRLHTARDHLTWHDICAAYDSGQEEIGIFCMKCVGYDIEFQRILALNYDAWLALDKVKKEEGKGKGKTGRAKGKKRKVPGKDREKTEGGKTGSKGKRVEAEESSELSSMEDSELEDVQDDPESEDSDIQILRYNPRGTRSRPQAT